VLALVLAIHSQATRDAEALVAGLRHSALQATNAANTAVGAAQVRHTLRVAWARERRAEGESQLVRLGRAQAATDSPLHRVIRPAGVGLAVGTGVGLPIAAAAFDASVSGTSLMGYVAALGIGGLSFAARPGASGMWGTDFAEQLRLAQMDLEARTAELREALASSEATMQQDIAAAATVAADAGRQLAETAATIRWKCDAVSARLTSLRDQIESRAAVKTPAWSPPRLGSLAVAGPPGAPGPERVAAPRLEPSPLASRRQFIVAAAGAAVGLVWPQVVQGLSERQVAAAARDAAARQAAAAAEAVSGIRSRSITIGAGSFVMGSAQDSDNQPHDVLITRPFVIGKCPVTQEEWESVMGDNPSYFIGPRRPVERVSWREAIKFCDKLSKVAGLKPVYGGNGEALKFDWAANGYRLPTEAEWEYACRAGSIGETYGELDEIA
jgi:formylglycine-generating enzyme required for sulfatase activity